MAVVRRYREFVQQLVVIPELKFKIALPPTGRKVASDFLESPTKMGAERVGQVLALMRELARGTRAVGEHLRKSLMDKSSLAHPLEILYQSAVRSCCRC